MPIWRSSELVVGRAGSPNRRSSARSSSSQPNSSRNSALPPLRLSGDGSGAGSESQQPAASTNAQYPQGLARPPSSRKAASGCASVSSISSWEASQAATMGSCPPYPAAGLPVSEQQTPSWESATSGATPRRRVSAGTYGMTSQTYTVQYIGIANGELGILSQKQKLAPQRSSGSGNTPPGAAPSAAAGATTAGGPRQRSRSAAPTPPSAPASVPAALSSRGSSAALPTAAYTPSAFLQEGAARSGSAAAAAQTPLGSLGSPAEAALDGSQSYASPGTHLLQRQASLAQGASGGATQPLEAAAAGDAAAPSAAAALRPPRPPLPVAAGPEGAGHEDYGLPRAPSPAHADVATDTTFANVAGGGVAPDSTQTPKPPSLASIVDDARGQVKVITECFYSRALHSRAAPHDRHTRRNRPLGPQVRDMEPLSTALPNRFAHRAPSAGGFSGWKLSTPSGTAAVASGSTAATAANALAGLRSTATATGSGNPVAASAAAASGGSATAAAAAAASAAAAAARRPRNSSGSAGRAPAGVASGSMLTGSSQAAASGGAGFGPWGDDGAAARPAFRGASGAMLKHQVQ